MDELIPIVNQGSDLMADSRHVADLFKVTHTHLRELIAANTAYLEQLGQIRVETESGKFRPQGGGSPVKFYYLNFDQVAFLLTISKPNKQDFIESFASMFHGHHQLKMLLEGLEENFS